MNIFFEVLLEKKVFTNFTQGKFLFEFDRNKIILISTYFSVSAALLRQATYGTIKIGIYQRIKRIFADDISRKNSTFVSMSINVDLIHRGKIAS